jgi:L,D-transpeptidase-like protein
MTSAAAKSGIASYLTGWSTGRGASTIVRLQIAAYKHAHGLLFGVLAILPWTYAATNGLNNSINPKIDEPEAAQLSPAASRLVFSVAGPVRSANAQRDMSPAGRYAAAEAVEIARSDFHDYFGSRRLAPGEFVWRADPSERSALHIVVSISDQRAYVYEGPILLAATTVSTGRKGHSTPVGIFPIIEKYELRLSNLYDDAPMPYMQRLTMDGIALHAGYIPGVPASHGCIRLPMAFARKLFSLTTSGTPVLIAT